MGNAFHEEPDSEVLKLLQSTIVEMRAEGVVNKIKKSYRK